MIAGLAKPGRRGLKAVLALMLALPAAGCLFGGEPPSPVARRSRPSHPVSVDPAQAAALISAFRAQNGLGPVTVNARLNAIATTQARKMAAENEMSHTVAGDFPERLAAGPYDADRAAENLGEGYDSLPDAMEGWKRSPGHRKNLLADVTEIGIATGYTPEGRSNVFWSLELARPHVRPAATESATGLVFVQ
jgi:uncharacterized protein YkwD